MQLPAYYEFCNRVKTIVGHKALEQIPQSLKAINAQRPMIITDKGVEQAGLIKIVLAAMQKSKLKATALFDNVPPDSDVKVVNEVAKIYRSKKCDSIIAVGGGSVLDTAKGVNIIVSENAADLMLFAGYGNVKRKLRPLVAVPTTAGTGSEVTSVAVIANHEKNIKMAFGSLFLLPDIAIIDSRMTKTLPPAITAFTGMDALTHAVEAYFCLAKNPLSDTTALAAIQLIAQNLVNVVKKPSDLDGRLALALASNLAGMAFSNSMVGMVHNIGHAIGGVCGVPHGVCMNILLPYGLEYNMHKASQYIGELLYPLAGEDVYNKTPKKDRPLKTVEYIRKLIQDLHDATDGKHPRFLKEVYDRNGNPMIPKEKLPDIAKTAMSDPAQFYNPEDLDYNDYIMVLEAAWEGIPLDRKKIKKG
ncbi:MAG: iron-containing alcohol dehydrogenase [Spirochaetes bacterium]|nr:iron-containing alcohol dehydrogenase [Spirochaetota bacterium]